MAQAESSTTIARPVGEVFAFILDGTKNKLWRPSVTDVDKVSGSPTGMGAAFKQGIEGPGGRRIDSDCEIVELKPNELIKFQVTAVFTGQDFQRM